MAKDAGDFLDDVMGQIDLGEASKTYVLAERFGILQFKDFQKKAINAALDKDTLIIQPTGQGKSLCYQFPAVYTSNKTIVITPTISLMQDKTYELQNMGIRSTYLGSAQTDPFAVKKAFDATDPIPILFVSPEWMFGKEQNLVLVKNLYQSGKLGLVALDEAHLMYEWAGFRQHYRQCEELHSLFPNTPIMALTATATPIVESKLRNFLHEPTVIKGTVNRPNIYLAAHQCSFRKLEATTNSFSIDQRDFSNFADKVAEIIRDECTIIYTDFASHVGPITLALRDRGIQAIGYYGKMCETEKKDAYDRWKKGEFPVMVATRAFGLGINKSCIRYVIRNGLPPSISAWAQELGRAGRDGEYSEAHIFYSDEDIHHVGFWNGDLARHCRAHEISDVTRDFSEALLFSYAHLVGKCRRKVFLDLFNDDSQPICSKSCCDVCCSDLVEMKDRCPELKVLLSAIDELGCRGEVKITEWIRGEVSWMKDIEIGENSAYGKSPRNLSKDWWRHFIRQAAAAGYIKRIIRTAKFGPSTGVYASLMVTEKGRQAINNCEKVLLPDKHPSSESERSCSSACTSSSTLSLDLDDSGVQKKRLRKGKGCNLLPIVKGLLSSKENWKTVDSKEDYQYPGFFSIPTSNCLYYAENISCLSHFTLSSPDFMWKDIQFSKGSTTRQLIECKIDGKLERLWFRRSECKGVKKCEECDNVINNAKLKNGCLAHPQAKLVKTEGCEVEFVHLCPETLTDKRCWIGGLLRRKFVQPSTNLHNHGVPSSHKIPQMVVSDLQSAVRSNPTVTTGELTRGVSLSYLPAAADLSAANYDILDATRKRAVRKTSIVTPKGPLVLLEMENIADCIDEDDSSKERSEVVKLEYRRRCRPYMKKYTLSPLLTYQLIMSPLMSSILAKSEYIEVDTTYNENTDLPFLLNVTAFDYNTMRWMAVARVRSNKEDSEAYTEVFKSIIEECRKDNKGFEVGKSLKGIVLDWSDTERKGLEAALGQEKAQKMMSGTLGSLIPKSSR